MSESTRELLASVHTFFFCFSICLSKYHDSFVISSHLHVCFVPNVLKFLAP